MGVPATDLDGSANCELSRNKGCSARASVVAFFDLGEDSMDRTIATHEPGVFSLWMAEPDE